MRGEFINVWSETWSNIWLPLAESEFAPNDMFCELYRELANAFKTSLSAESLADVIDNQQQSWDAFKCAESNQFADEATLVRFFEAVFEVLEDLQGDDLSNLYFGYLSAFIDKYSLGYSLRRPCALSPTLAGIFSDLTSSLKEFTETDEHLASLYRAHEESIRDLRLGATEERIKTCIGRQVMLMEAIAATSSNVTARTLGDMCDQLNHWPHKTIQQSLKKLYGFTSDYPGIRHAGNPEGKIRDIDSRDLASLSILLTGYSHYLTAALSTTLQTLIAK